MKMKSQAVLDQIRQFESPDTTHIDPQGGWPIVWDQARGCTVTDVEGKTYLDLTAAFGVAAAGHANPKVVRAATRQMRRLLHGMGDVHPNESKVLLAKKLSEITPGNLNQSGGARGIVVGPVMNLSNRA